MYFTGRLRYSNYQNKEDLEILFQAVQEGRDIIPYKCGRNPHNRKLILWHEDIKVKLIVLSDFDKEKLLDLIAEKIEELEELEGYRNPFDEWKMTW